MRSARRLASGAAIALAVSTALLGQSAASAGTGARAAISAPAGSAPQIIRPFGAHSAVSPDTLESWSQGSCPSFLPDDTGAFVPPGVVNSTWAPLQSEAIGQTEELYGITSDPSSLYAEDYARDITRAFMFADLVQAVDDVAAGHGTATETTEVQGFEQVVQYGREWVAVDAANLFDSINNASAIQSGITNDILSVVFGFIGLPWQGQSDIPSVTQLLNQAQEALWATPTTATDGGGDQIPNFPIGGAESQQAMQRALGALTYLSAIGQTQLHAGASGTNSSLDSVMGQIENALGAAGGGSVLADAAVNVANIGAALSNTDSIDHASLIESLVNIVWQGADTAVTDEQIISNETASQALPSAPDLQTALGNPATFDELFSDFTALTLHTLPSGTASGNDPDCRQVDKTRDGATPPGPTGSDPTMQVQHVTPAGTADYSYSTQVLGGARTDAGNSSGEISDPAVTDWSLSRDTGPGSPRLGANWPISEITYGSPGPAGAGYGLDSPSTFFPASGSWYLTFKGANGQAHQTAPLSISSSNNTVHPTDSEVEQAIINADPEDFPSEPCSGPDASDEDPAVPAADQGEGPCTDWNPATFNGTDVLVSGDQPDGNTNAPPDYQVIFDIMIKGDLGGWNPVFTAHTDTCGNGGICVFTLLGAPLVGENITSNTIWPMQQTDGCQNDPHTCVGNSTFGWGDQVVDQTGDFVPQPYPVSAECQALSPVAGLLQLQYVGKTGGNPNCNAAPNSGSWVLSSNIRYQSFFGSDWTAWRVPSSVGTDSFLNIETAAVSPGTAGIDSSCDQQVSGRQNAFCLEGQGTHWLSEFAPGDQILLTAPSDQSGNGTGGQLSMVRTVGTVVDDTHMLLTTSAECMSGSDGNDCDFYNTTAYTSFMNPANGSQGSQVGMITLPCGADCVSSPTKFLFSIKKLTGLNAGTNCSTWTPSPASLHPPTTGCFYSDTLQFRAQDGTAKGWWNLSLPQVPSATGVTGQHAAQQPQAPLAKGDGPWINAPAVTRQPQDVAAGAGSTATFTVAAKGTPAPKIQWEVSRNHAVSWAKIPGATAASVSVAVTAAESGFDYRAVVTNANGTRTTQWGTLDVVSAPVITKNPQSTKTLHRGDRFSFSSAATGDPAPAPTWELSLDGGATWQVLEAGRADVSFTLPSAPLSGAVRRAITAGGAAHAPGSAAARTSGGSVPDTAATSPDLVRVVYQNAYGSATSRTAAINFSDTFPDVTVGAAVSPAPPAVGDPASALITVGNHSGVKATSVKAVATFSASLALSALKQLSGPKATCKVRTVTGGKAETCTWATLPGHSQATFRASLRPKSGSKTGTIAVNATLAQTNGALGTTSLTVPIVKPWADVQLSGTAPKTEKLGTAFSDVLTVRDAGPAAAAKTKVTISLPALVRLVKTTGPGAKCTTRKATVTCTIARLLSGRAVKLTLHLKGVKKGASTLVAQVSAATPDYAQASNSISLSTLVR